MTISTDMLLERIKLKGLVRRWRVLAILALTLLVVSVVGVQFKIPGKSYIARLIVKDMILIDSERDEAIEEVMSNKSVKAVIVSIDSPGGTASGGESLYYSLRELQKQKPVVVVMGNMATSAGYLIATPADRIFARQATLTGSIGVLLEVPNIRGLAEKVGVTMQTIKTGDLKGAPSLFEGMKPKTRQVMQGLVDDFYEVFVGIISEHRIMPRKKVLDLADGRVYSGRQAVKNGLVDEIGGQTQAISWLEENKNIEVGLDVFDIKYGKVKNPLDQLLNALSAKSLLPTELSTQGLLSVWKNSVIN